MLSASIKFWSVVIGNVPGARDPNSGEALQSHTFGKPVNRNVSHGRVLVVMFRLWRRGQQRKKIHPLILPKLEPLDITPLKFAEFQSPCSSLSLSREKVNAGEQETMRDVTVYEFEMVDGLMYRSCVNSKSMRTLASVLLLFLLILGKSYLVLLMKVLSLAISPTVRQK